MNLDIIYEEKTIIDDAYAALRNEVANLYANNINYPKINIKIDWLELSQTEEYKQYSALERVELGDTIHAEIFGLNYTTRVIKTIYNPLNDRIEKFEIHKNMSITCFEIFLIISQHCFQFIDIKHIIFRLIECANNSGHINAPIGSI